jgi:hypothetical protein
MYKSHKPYSPPTSVIYYSCYVSRPILAPPLLWLQKHTDLRVQVSQTLQPSYLSHILQMLRKQTNTGTSTSLTAETHWSICTSLTNLNALLSQSHNCSCYVSRPILASPPLWLQKHTDLHVQFSQTLQPSYLSHILQMLCKQTNTGTSTTLTAETRWSTCTSLTNLTALLTQSHITAAT